MHITDGKNIYNHLQDEISKFIFGKRLLYSMTGDKRFILEMIESIPEVQALKAIICQRRDNFIFGAEDGALCYAGQALPFPLPK